MRETAKAQLVPRSKVAGATSRSNFWAPQTGGWTGKQTNKRDIIIRKADTFYFYTKTKNRVQRLHSAHDLFYNFSLLFYVKMRPHKGLANGGVGQVCRGSILDAEALFFDPKPYVIRREGGKRAKSES